MVDYALGNGGFARPQGCLAEAAWGWRHGPAVLIRRQSVCAPALAGAAKSVMPGSVLAAP